MLRDLSKALCELWRAATATDEYRPERHYMRGQDRDGVPSTEPRRPPFLGISNDFITTATLSLITLHG